MDGDSGRKRVAKKGSYIKTTLLDVQFFPNSPVSQAKMQPQHDHSVQPQPRTSCF